MHSRSWIIWTLRAADAVGSKRWASHSSASCLARARPMIPAPKVRTWALLESTEARTDRESWAVTARTPGTLFAAMATPRPV